MLTDEGWKAISEGNDSVFREYQSELKGASNKGWVIKVPDDYKIDNSCRYRIVHEFIVFSAWHKSEYEIIEKIIYIQ